MNDGINAGGYVENEMYDRMNYGRGNNSLAYGNDVLAANAHADGSGLGTKVECNGRSQAAQLDRISAQAEESRRINAFDSVKDGQFRSELRNSDQLRDIERVVVNGQKESAACCCDAKLEAQKNACDTQKIIFEQSAATNALIASNAATTNALILASESRSVERALNNANAELISLKTQVACGCCTPK